MSNLRATLLRLLLAVGLSFSLWAFVSFSQNPEDTTIFNDVPLQAIGLEPGLVMVDANGVPTQALPPVDITLSAGQQQLAQLRPVDVRAVVDLSGRGAGEHVVPVNVQPTRSNLSFTVPPEGAQPSSVSIRLEALSARQVPVELDVRGNLPFSFERGEPSISFGGDPIVTAQVEGPQSQVARVTEARAQANIEQLRATYLAPLSLTAVDAGGVTVDGVTITPETVTVEIPINPVVGLKLVPVQPVIQGLPAPGYEITGVLVEPPLIALTGGSGPLDDVELLTTAPIEIGGITQTVVRSAQILVPENTAPRLGEPEVVRVTLQVAPIALPFQAELPVSITLAGVGNGLQASTNPQVTTVSVSGPSASIAALAQSPLRGTADVAGLGPGSYQIPLALDLPDGVNLVGDPPTVQVILRTPPTLTVPTPTPEPTETEEPTAIPATATPEPSETPASTEATPGTATATPEVSPTPTP
jgi:YbbR domain-containing protein